MDYQLIIVMLWLLTGLGMSVYGIWDQGRLSAFDLFVAIFVALSWPLVIVGVTLHDVFKWDDKILWKKK